MLSSGREIHPCAATVKREVSSVNGKAIFVFLTNFSNAFKTGDGDHESEIDELEKGLPWLNYAASNCSPHGYDAHQEENRSWSPLPISNHVSQPRTYKTFESTNLFGILQCSEINKPKSTRPSSLQQKRINYTENQKAFARISTNYPMIVDQLNITQRTKSLKLVPNILLPCSSAQTKNTKTATRLWIILQHFFLKWIFIHSSSSGFHFISGNISFSFIHFPYSF